MRGEKTNLNLKRLAGGGGGAANCPLPPPSFPFGFSKTGFSREDVNLRSLFFCDFSENFIEIP